MTRIDLDNATSAVRVEWRVELRYPGIADVQHLACPDEDAARRQFDKARTWAAMKEQGHVGVVLQKRVIPDWVDEEWTVANEERPAEMVERAAYALLARDRPSIPWDNARESARAHYLDLARVALAAAFDEQEASS